MLRLSSVILVIILLLINPFVKNIVIGLFIDFTIFAVILHWFINNIWLSLLISAAIVGVLYYHTITVEGYEDMTKELNDLVDIKPEEIGDNKDTTDYRKPPKENEKDDKYITPVKAQRETFRLINTIKQLEETMKSMEPTLKQGANLMEKMKALGF